MSLDVETRNCSLIEVWMPWPWSTDITYYALGALTFATIFFTLFALFCSKRETFRRYKEDAPKPRRGRRREDIEMKPRNEPRGRGGDDASIPVRVDNIQSFLDQLGSRQPNQNSMAYEFAYSGPCAPSCWWCCCPIYTHHFLVTQVRSTVDDQVIGTSDCIIQVQEYINDSFPLIDSTEHTKEPHPAAGGHAGGCCQGFRVFFHHCPLLCIGGKVKSHIQVLSEVLKRRTLYFVKKRPIDTAMRHRMERRLGEVGWLPDWNNCEQYTNYVMTGKHEADQLEGPRVSLVGQLSMFFLLNGIGRLLVGQMYTSHLFQTIIKALTYYVRAVLAGNSLDDEYSVWDLISFAVVVVFELINMLIDCYIVIHFLGQRVNVGGWRVAYLLLKAPMAAACSIAWVLGGSDIGDRLWKQAYPRSLPEIAMTFWVMLVGEGFIVPFIGMILDLIHVRWRSKCGQATVLVLTFAVACAAIFFSVQICFIFLNHVYCTEKDFPFAVKMSQLEDSNRSSRFG